MCDRKILRSLALFIALSLTFGSNAQRGIADHSVLASGQWYKIPVQTSGIYKLTPTDIPALEGVSCSSIALYGDGEGMLSASNRVAVPYDVTPAAIEVVDLNGNGLFDKGDYLLFYGEGPSVWRFNNRTTLFEYHMHAYANYNYYYLTLSAPVDAAAADSLRIPTSQNSDFNRPDLTTHTGVALIHNDNINALSGGQIWIDSKFSYSGNQRTLNFTFPTVDGLVRARYGLASTSSQSSLFTVSNSSATRSHNLSYGNSYQTFNESFSVSPSGNLTFTISYTPQESNATGYFDFFELNGSQPISYAGGQYFIRNTQIFDENTASRFLFDGGLSGMKVWDVTHSSQPMAMPVAIQANGQSFFVGLTDQARTFVAFTDADALTPSGITPLESQDIRGTATPDYVIVTHSDFLSQAQTLADLHRQHSGLSVLVVTQEQVFNEFSSGRPDPVAIRRMLRCLRSKNTDAQNAAPRYLLLFGKGTYDNRDILQAHIPTVITYQTSDSFDDESNVYPSDDIYGYLDSLAVGDFEGSISVGIGRLPAKSVAEATHMVQKIEHYLNRSDLAIDGIRGDWRNYVTLLADDADPSLPGDSVFASDSEKTARSIKALYPQLNIDRIYADSYIQQSGADGSYYPDVNNALRQRINYGTLLLNYIGHGSSNYIGTERYMEISDIEKYANTDRLTFFITSTCSFGRYDQAQDICGAEAFLLADAAGIGIISAARPIHHTQVFNTNCCLYVLNPLNTIGDALRLAKNYSGTSHCIALMGDPALHLSLPTNQVVVTHVNGHPVDPLVTDSAQVLSRVTVEGEIRNPDGTLLDDFDGTIYPIVFDREVRCRTLANDNDSTEVSFMQQKNILYKGRETVTHGRFSYSFIIPRDVAYRYDYAKLSHYATNGREDATGEYSNIMFGGFNEDIVINELHPTVELYINDTNFRNGGLTNETPTIYARLSDSVGINAAGCGLGHDITAIIDNNPYSTVTLNDFFEPDIFDSRNGEVRYTLGKLDEGYHTLTVRCWNIFNYSGSATIGFRVANDRTAQIGLFAAAPNPAHDRTTLRIEHNLTDAITSAIIHIYDIRGRHLREVMLSPSGPTCVLTYPWDFTTDDGTLLPKGIYIARVLIHTADGQVLQQNTKIVRN